MTVVALLSVSCMFLATVPYQEKVEIMFGGPVLGRQVISNVMTLFEVIKIKILCVNNKLVEPNLYFNLEI